MTVVIGANFDLLSFILTTIVQYKVLLPWQLHIVELQPEHMQLERNGCLWRLEAEKNLHPDRIICYCIKFILFSVYKREKIGAAKKTSPKKPSPTWKRDTLGYRGGHFPRNECPHRWSGAWHRKQRTILSII